MRSSNLRSANEKPPQQFQNNYSQQQVNQTLSIDQNNAASSQRNADSRAPGQFVQQVIYNNGKLVINNPVAETSANFQMLQQPNKQNNQGHSKTKSTSFVVGQDGVLINQNDFSYGRPQQTSVYQTDLTKQLNLDNSVHQKESTNAKKKQEQLISSFSIKSNEQMPGTMQPGHKKSQSMINSKIANLLIKGQKKSAMNMHPQQNDSSDVQKSIDMMMLIKSGQNNTFKNQRNMPRESCMTEEEENFIKGFNNDQIPVRETDIKPKNLQLNTFQGAPPTHQRQQTAGIDASFFKNLDFSVRAENPPPSVQKRMSGSSQIRPQSNSINTAAQAATPYNVAQAKIKSRTADKIASNGKIIASGVAVKKPPQKLQQPQQVQIQQVPISTQHHRVKSDQHQSLKSKEIVSGNGSTNATIQQQKGKVGKILKNNFVETAMQGQNQVTHNIPANSSIPVSQAFTLQQKNIIRTFQQPPSSNNQIVQPIQLAPQQQSFAEALNKSKKKSVSFNNPALQNPKQKNVKEVKRVQGKPTYQELQGLYNELFEQHVNLHNLISVGGNMITTTNENSANSSFHLKQQQIARKNKFAAKNVNHIAGSSADHIVSLKSKETSHERGSSWEAIESSNYLKLTDVMNQVHQINEIYPPPASSSNSNQRNMFTHSQVNIQTLQNNNSNLVSLNSDECKFKQPNESINMNRNQPGRENSKFQVKKDDIKNKAILFQNQQIEKAQLLQNLMKHSQDIIKKQTCEHQSPISQQQKVVHQKQNQSISNPISKLLVVSHRRSVSDGVTDLAQIAFNMNKKSIHQDQLLPEQLASGQNQAKREVSQSSSNRVQGTLAKGKTSNPDLRIEQSRTSNRQNSAETKAPIINLAAQEIVKKQLLRVPQMKVDLSRTVEQQPASNVSKKQNEAYQLGTNPKYRVTELTENNESEEDEMVINKKQQNSLVISFHHPKLSGNNWQRAEQAMVIQENSTSNRSSPDSNGIQVQKESSRQKYIKVNPPQKSKPISKQEPLVNNLLVGITEPSATKHTHTKNKLSMNSDNTSAVLRQEQQPEIVLNYLDQHKPEKPTHKRVKSDAVETLKQKLITDAQQATILNNGNSNTTGQRSLKTLPKKQQNIDQQSVYEVLRNNIPDQQKNSSIVTTNLKRDQMVNVNIDDPNDIEDESKNNIAANWLRVPAEDMQNKNWQHGIISKFQKEQRDTISQDRVQNKIKNSFDLVQGEPSDNVKLDKYKQILKKAKQNFHSKSEIPGISQIHEAKPVITMMIIESQPKQGIEDKKTPAKIIQDIKKSSKVINSKVKPEIIKQQELNVAPQNSLNTSMMVPIQDQGYGLNNRLVTSQSIDSDLPAESKVILKLVHHIKKSYAQQNTCPETTVDFYKVGKVLGKGAFGRVNLSMHQLTQEFVAIKSINKTHFSEASQSKKVMQEVMILKQTRHNNIVQLYEYFETQKHILFVIGLSDGGDLLSYVRKRRQLKEDVAKSVFKQLIEGLRYCHSKNILHRDIKLDNILLSAEGEVKICDFGVSKVVRKGEKLSEQCGTPAYIAPEILLDKGYEGFACDIWSAGVVLYAMLYGTVPFKANNMSELQKMIIKGKYTLQEGICKDAKDLLQKLLEKDPLQRLTIPNILAHPFMKDAKERVQLFTNAEKKYMKSEFNVIEGGDPNKVQNGDPFMDQMMDSCHNSMLKNAETKSIILAPFNTTMPNLEEIENNYSLPSEIKDLIQSKSCLKFHARAKEIDQQYEVNNNAELDNGVYHDFNKDEEAKDQAKSSDSLEDDFKNTPNQSQDADLKKKNRRQTELQKLEKMIKNQEGEEYSERIVMHQSNNLHNNRDVDEMQPIRAEAPLIIDEEIVQKVTEFGYPSDQLRKYLTKNELNSATTSYYLLNKLKQDQRAEESIADNISPI